MKKLIYTVAFALLAMGFVACSGAEDDITDAVDDLEETLEDEVTEEKTEELNNTLDLQEEAEKLDKELEEFNKSL